MSKKLFKRYDFEFDKNDKKLLITFCSQVIRQMEGDQRFARDVNVFSSIISKLKQDTEKVKLTKEEKTKLVLQLKENIKYAEKEMKKSWFIKRWMLKSMYKQYVGLIQKYFEE
jgi:hypothetical protein